MVVFTFFYYQKVFTNDSKAIHFREKLLQTILFRMNQKNATITQIPIASHTIRKNNKIESSAKIGYLQIGYFPVGEKKC